MLQHGVAIEYAPSPILSAVQARVLPHQAQKCIDPYLQAPPSLVRPPPPTNLLAVRPLAVCPIVTTFSILQIPAGPRPLTAQTLNAHKSTLQRFSVHCVRNVSRGPTTSGRICAPTQTNAHLYAVFAAKRSLVSMTVSATKDYTRERRSLSAAVI
jgi:hypothetical protein